MIAPCPSGCSASSVFSVIVTGVKNPPYRMPTQTKSIEIQTMTSDLQWIKDKRTTLIFTTPDLTLGAISGASLTKLYGIIN
jgi:hypothetical protein